MTKHRPLLVTMLIIMMTLTACGWRGSGTVVAKDYNRSYTSTTQHCQTRTQGTTRTKSCRNEPVYHPATFSLLVRDDKDRAEHWVPVSQLEYLAHPVGSRFKNGE